MRGIGLLFVGSALVVVTGVMAAAQGPEAAQPPVGTMNELMTDMIHPAANAILLVTARGGPQNDAEWREVQRAAVLLAESGNALMERGRARDQGNWLKDAKALGDLGSAAYRASGAKDGKALSALSDPIRASCLECHKQYRPNVHPRT